MLLFNSAANPLFPRRGTTNLKFASILVGVILAFVFLALLIYPTINTNARQEMATALPIDLSEYEIIYFGNGGEDHLTAENIARLSSAEVFSDWVLVSEYTNRVQVDALIIDETLISEIDPSELGVIYRNGTVLAFINVYSTAVVELTNDECIGDGDWMDGTAEPMSGDFYIVVARLVSGSREDVETIENQLSCSGQGEILGVEGVATIYRGRAAESLNDQTGLELFLRVILSKVASVDSARNDSELK